jgi:cytochrome c oxidase cbb3-type subunit 3
VKRSGSLVGLVVALASLLSPACKARSAPTDSKASAAEEPFTKYCAPCHGADAKGYAADHAPSLVNATFLESATDDYLRKSIRWGRPGTSMAAYAKQQGGPLDDATVDRIVAWLRARGPQPKPLPDAPPGNAERGANVYRAICERCHGERDSRRDAVHLANPRFLDVATNAFLRHAIVNGRPGTPMIAFQGQLIDREIDDAVAYIRTFSGPPPIGELPAPTGKEPLVLNPRGAAPAFTLRADHCPPKDAGGPPCTEGPRYVSVDQVRTALEGKRRIIIVDARPASDWMRVHIPGAVSIPHHDLTRLAEVPRDGTWVVAYCACPHHLSGVVVDELHKRGHAHAAILDEGVLEWHRRGYPVVAAPGVTAPPKELGPTGAASGSVVNGAPQ